MEMNKRVKQKLSQIKKRKEKTNWNKIESLKRVIQMENVKKDPFQNAWGT